MDKDDVKDLNGRKCHFCNKIMSKIGFQRKNGKDAMLDYKGRKYHKQCFKDVMLLQRVLKNIEIKI